MSHTYYKLAYGGYMVCKDNEPLWEVKTKQQAQEDCQELDKEMTLAEQLAPGLSEDQVLAQGFKLLSEQLGVKAAQHYFYYDLDYPSDLVSEYFNLNNLETV